MILTCDESAGCLLPGLDCRKFRNRSVLVTIRQDGVRQCETRRVIVSNTLLLVTSFHCFSTVSIE